MIRKLAEWYIRNKSKITMLIIILVLLIIISITVNLLSVKERNNAVNNTIKYEDLNEEQVTIGNYTDIYIENNQSVVTGESINTSQVNDLKYIEQFVEQCNEQNINEAYNMLSNECKEETYPTLDSFRNNYYNKIFNGQSKKASVENWANNIYKVKFEDDFLSTGIYSQDNTRQDYISVVTDENDELRLNINNYIGRTEINKEGNSEGVNIIVLTSDSYMEYQIYSFRITNNTNNTILLDNRNNTNNMYLEDSNKNQYTAYIHELSEAQLTLTPKETKEIKIKYYNKNGTTKDITDIVFKEIILNYGDIAPRKTTSIQIEL